MSNDMSNGIQIEKFNTSLHQCCDIFEKIEKKCVSGSGEDTRGAVLLSEKMTDNKDDNNTSEELPLYGGGDIEQGGSTTIPENTDSVWSSEAAAITPPSPPSPPSKWTLGELEEVDVVEDAAPVPLIQHIAGMGIKKDDIRASDSVSASLPRPPTQDVRPTVMEDDSQRPKPSEYVTFESNADDEFNRRLLAKAVMAADLKGETKRPT
eukprot:scaffold32658_cov66-Skeletonema_marinoi.AAC.1